MVWRTRADIRHGDGQARSVSLKMDPRLTIVIPAFNEARTVGGVVERLTAECAILINEIIVVNDGSSDETGQIAAEGE
jgi:glycosyltransferase involved in cell wall biosynthesis